MSCIIRCMNLLQFKKVKRERFIVEKTSTKRKYIQNETEDDYVDTHTYYRYYFWTDFNQIFIFLVLKNFPGNTSIQIKWRK
jgi:hypothetical protein